MTERAGAKCILVVEDHDFIRLLLVESLVDAGYDVLEAEAGEQAMAMLDRISGVDALVTDIQMPGRFDGNAVAIAIRKRHPHLPVVYMTGRPDSLTNPLGSRDAFLRKPLTPSEVVKAIDRLFATGTD